jgi:hypothetical protein
MEGNSAPQPGCDARIKLLCQSKAPEIRTLRRRRQSCRRSGSLRQRLPDKRRPPRPFAMHAARARIERRGIGGGLSQGGASRHRPGRWGHRTAMSPASSAASDDGTPVRRAKGPVPMRRNPAPTARRALPTLTVPRCTRVRAWLHKICALTGNCRIVRPGFGRMLGGA